MRRQTVSLQAWGATRHIYPVIDPSLVHFSSARLVV